MKFITLTIALALGAVMAPLVPATNANAAEIKLAVGCPPVPACADWVWAVDVAEHLKKSGLEAKVFVGGALGKDPEIIDQLSQGLVQIGLTNFVMIAQVDKRILGFISAYMFDDMDHFFRASKDSDMVRSIDANMQKQGIRIAGLTGLGGLVGIFNAKKPIRSIADLDGIRLRAIDDSQIKLFEQWGAAGAVIDMPEFATSVQQGVVDGYFNPPIVAIIFRHMGILKHYTPIGGGTPFRSALMSNDWYNGLDDDTRAKVDAAVNNANANNVAWTKKAIETELAILKKGGVTITEPSEAALAEFKELSMKVWSVLMPADAVDAFVALAAKTRK